MSLGGQSGVKNDLRIAAIFVRRPVLAIVVNLLVVVAGIAAFMGIEVRELPDVDRPIITIRTNYDGATPETVDKEITAIIESAVARTPGVSSISSQSRSGQSRITVEFRGHVFCAEIIAACALSTWRWCGCGCGCWSRSRSR